MKRVKFLQLVFLPDFSQFLGRITNKRSAGSKLFFYDIRSGETTLQVMSSLGTYSSEGDTPEEVFDELTD